jgi:hypothetical protein
MTDTWFAFAIVAGALLIVDLITTQLRRRARRLPDARPGRGEDQVHVHEE